MKGSENGLPTFYHIKDNNARHDVSEFLEFWTGANDNRTTHTMTHQLKNKKA